MVYLTDITLHQQNVMVARSDYITACEAVQDAVRVVFVRARGKSWDMCALRVLERPLGGNINIYITHA